MNRTLRRTSGLAALALAATMGFTACSSDDSGSDDAATDTTSESSDAPMDESSDAPMDAGAETFGAAVPRQAHAHQRPDLPRGPG